MRTLNKEDIVKRYYGIVPGEVGCQKVIPVDVLREGVNDLLKQEVNVDQDGDEVMRLDIIRRAFKVLED